MLIPVTHRTGISKIFWCNVKMLNFNVWITSLPFSLLHLVRKILNETPNYRDFLLLSVLFPLFFDSSKGLEIFMTLIL